MTRGIVSALNRPNPSSDDARKPGQFIQTDAAINPGNSGGPLVNARGEVVGINTFLISPSGSFSGMGFAIPTQIVRPTVEKLIQFGKVTHGYMGIGIADVTPDNSKFFHMDKRGAVVTQVEPDSPGAKAGLKVGDVITQIDGKEVSDAGELQVVVGQTESGDDDQSASDARRQERGRSQSRSKPWAAATNPGRKPLTPATGKPRWGVGLWDITPDDARATAGPGRSAGSGDRAGAAGQPGGQRWIAVPAM